MPPLIFLPEVDFCVCLHVALCCGVFRKSPVYNLSQVPLEACHGAWYITGAQKNDFLNECTNFVLHQAELNKNPPADI